MIREELEPVSFRVSQPHEDKKRGEEDDAPEIATPNENRSSVPAALSPSEEPEESAPQPAQAPPLPLAEHAEGKEEEGKHEDAEEKGPEPAAA